MVEPLMQPNRSGDVVCHSFRMPLRCALLLSSMNHIVKCHCKLLILLETLPTTV